jgi:integrase
LAEIETKFAFTDRAIKALKPAKERIDYRDLGCPGLTLRVSKTGIKTFRWIYRGVDGKHKLLTIGKYPDVGLAKARGVVEEEKQLLKQKRSLGSDQYRHIKTVAQLAEDFYELLETTRKRPQEARRMLDLDIIPSLGRLPLSPPPHPPVIGAMIRKIVRRGAPVHAGKVLNLVKQMFDHGLGNGHIKFNPAAPLKAVSLGVQKYQPKDRALDREEIIAFWKVLPMVPRMDQRTRLAFKVLLLTGVRTQELLLAKWSDVDLETGKWTIPVENQKLTVDRARSAKPFVIPLAPFVVAQFDELLVLSEGSPWVVSSDSSESGHYDDKVLGRALRRIFEKEITLANGRKEPLLNIERFTPHDLRRTMRTHLGETLNIEPHIAERCLNHSMGKLTQTYDTGRYYAQREEAMRRWSEFVELAVEPVTNITQFTKRA